MELPKEELEELKELSDISTLSQTPGWLRLKDQLKEWSEEAQEDMMGNESSDPMTALRLQIRWQQREGVSRAIVSYIESGLDRLATIKAEIAARAKEHESHAGAVQD